MIGRVVGHQGTESDVEDLRLTQESVRRLGSHLVTRLAKNLLENACLLDQLFGNGRVQAEKTLMDPVKQASDAIQEKHFIYAPREPDSPRGRVTSPERPACTYGNQVFLQFDGGRRDIWARNGRFLTVRGIVPVSARGHSLNQIRRGRHGGHEHQRTHQRVIFRIGMDHGSMQIISRAVPVIVFGGGHQKSLTKKGRLNLPRDALEYTEVIRFYTSRYRMNS